MVSRKPNPLGLITAAEEAWLRLALVVRDDGDRVPCTGRHADRWTSDDPDEREAAAHQCGGCPAIQPCRQYADAAGERHHVWAGVDRTRRTAATRRTA